MPRLGPALVLLLATLASAHPQGFHKRLTFTVSRARVEGLVVMDVDSGERCRLIREGADQSRDGLLEPDELAWLKAKLVSLATAQLKLGISGFPLPVVVKDAKLSVREDRSVSDTGLSIAVLLELHHPHQVTPGMSFEVQDTSPDLSTVVVEVFQATAPGAPAEAPVRLEAESGRNQKIRLGNLELRP